MGKSDKLRHSAESAEGNAKEKLGRTTNDKSMENKGKAKKSKADLKQAGEKVKDAFR